MGSPPQGYVASSVIPQELWYDVRDYGAVGNGTADDTTPIQNAINAANTAGGGVVWMPANNYKITSALTLKSMVNLKGVFPFKSVIDPTPPGSSSDLTGGTLISGTTAINAFTGNSLQGVSVENIGLRNFLNGFTHGTSNTLGMAFSRFQNIYFYNVTGTCMILDNFQFVRIDHMMGINVNQLIKGINDHTSSGWNGGNSVWTDIYGELNSTVQGGIELQAINNILNLIDIHRPQINFRQANTGGTLGTGIYLHGPAGTGPNVQWINVYGADIEGTPNIGFELVQATRNHLELAITDASTHFKLTSNSIQNQIMEVHNSATTKHFDIGGGCLDNSFLYTINPPKISYGVGQLVFLGATPRDTTATGIGVVSVAGVDNRSGLTGVDGSPITIHTVPALSGTLYRVSIDIYATAFTSGTATYTLTWTENAQSKTLVVTATAINVLGTGTDLVNPDSGTTITVQLTGVFTATVKVAAVVEPFA